MNNVGIDEIKDKRKSCPNNNQKVTSTNHKQVVLDVDYPKVIKRHHDPFMQQLLKQRRHSQLIEDDNQRCHSQLIEDNNPDISMKPKTKNVLDEIVGKPISNQKIMENSGNPALTNHKQSKPDGNYNSYSYASTEFRPMDIKDDGLHSSPINDKTKSSKRVDNLYSYAHVDVRPMVVGKQCALTTPINDINQYEPEVEHSLINGDLYAVVDKNPKQTLNEELYDEIKPTKTNISNTETNQPIECLYTPIDYNTKQKIITENTKASDLDFSEIRKRGGGGRRTTDGMIDTPYFNDAKKRIQPKIPKPYAQGRNFDLPTHSEEANHNAANQLRHRLDSFNRNSVSTEDMLGSYTTLDTSYNTTNKKHNFLSHTNNTNERLSKSSNNEDLKEIKTYKKQHRRMKSHETIIRNYAQPIVDLNDSKASNSSSSKSSILSESHSPLSISKESDDSERSLHDIIQSELIDELPEGWQEVKDGAETYYWHIWTGTIQYERPLRSTTPSSSSRSISPFSSQDSTTSSRAASVADSVDERKGSMTSSPVMMDTPPPDKPKQVISFPVHSMGWMNVDESKMDQSLIGDTVNNCITELAEKRHDLWNTSETWAEGSDIKLILEGETLKLLEPKSKNILHVQPIAKMRVWGVGRVETRDFAYIARHQSSGKHRCHMFRCHGHVSGRSITNALQAICNRVLDEKRRAKERSDSPSVRSSSDLLKPPSKVQSNFNEKPFPEQKKCFTAKYVGQTEVSRSSGVDLVNKAVAKLSEGQQTSDWSSVLVEVTTSEIKTIDCIKQHTLMEHRVRYVTFLAIAQDERFAAYIVAVARDTFICQVFFCAPHAGTLTKAIEEACKLRFEKMLDGRVRRTPSTSQDATDGDVPQKPTQQPDAQQPASSALSRDTVKEKTKSLTSSIAGVFTKLNKKDNKKKEEEQSITLNANEYLVKYFGSVTVDIGTGIEAVQKAVKGLAGGQMMMGYLQVQSDCITLSDSQRTALSKRTFDLNAVSYCGMTSDRKHFGVILSCGKGKYICHVFQEYKPNLGHIVSAIHDVL